MRWLVFLICFLPLAALAQDSEAERDRDFLTAFLEDNLSGAGRTIRLEGFQGALSSKATFDLLSIADDDGVWLAIRDGAISWNRSALLRGRVEIAELSAGEIDVMRKPLPGPATAEASGFSLPDLPVSVSVGILRADRVKLAEDLFGAAAEVTVDGSMQLSGGEGSADLTVARIDGQEGRVAFKGKYSNASREATLDLLVAEGSDGIAANLLDLPGRPSVELAVHGTGVIDDFRTDIALSSEGAPRLSGVVTFRSAAEADGATERRFSAQLEGDIAPLLLPEYQTFFGSSVSLEADGMRDSSGQLDLTRLVIGAKGLDISGRLSLSPGGLPLEAALTARLGLADGSDVLLPIPGERTYVNAADLRLRYDAANSDGWVLKGTLGDLRRSGFSIDSVRLDGSGRIARPGQAGVATGRIGGHVTFETSGIALVDPALAEAAGKRIAGRAIFDWQQGKPFRLPVLEVTGEGYAASGGLSISANESGPEVSGRLSARIDSMARFSGLAQRPLSGSADMSLRGSAGLLSGIFDVDGRITGTDLAISQAELDGLLAGQSEVIVSAIRDESGIVLRNLDLRAATLSATVTGLLRTGASDLEANLDFTDIGALGPRYRGALKGTARLTENGQRRQLQLDADASGLAIGQAEADRLLAGASTLSVTAEEENGTISLTSFRLENPQVSATATGARTEGRQTIELAARLNNMALLAPGFPGPLTAEGRVSETESGYGIDLSAAGPGATSARIEGSVASDFSTTDLSLRGGAQSAIVNPFIAPRNVSGPVSFDLTLRGAPGLQSLAGRVSLDGGRLVAPTFGIELQDTGIAASIGNGSVAVSGSAAVRGGGRIELSGPVSLSAPFAGDLALRLAQVRLRDPDLYETLVDGAVRLNGPLTGGAMISGTINMGRTEIRVPSTGLGTDPVLTDIRHVNEPPSVAATRRRAGLADQSDDNGKSGASFGIDMTVSAPQEIFVRGRGLDAEMGGAIAIRGTTDNIIPSGQFNLIRGRLDILGKRFTIDEGLVQIQGALSPYIRFSARSSNSGVNATILIEGEATSPEIRFLSTPELPEEEVIAQLLFGRSLATLSPFQAAQLASAVAELAGKGGEGIVSKLRGSFGLDDLDVTTDADGSAALRAGKYISDRLYTDVEIGADGKSQVNLNLDVRSDVKVRGSVDSEGSTGIGIYFERDY